MTFQHLSDRDARDLRVILGGAYLAVTWAGVTGKILTPVTIQGVLGWTTYVWAALAIIGGLAGLWAVIRNDWRIEMWAAPFAAGGAFGYVTAVWALLFSETLGRAPQAGWVTLGLFMLAFRAREVWAAAKRDRQRHDRVWLRRTGRK